MKKVKKVLVAVGAGAALLSIAAIGVASYGFDMTSGAAYCKGVASYNSKAWHLYVPCSEAENPVIPTGATVTSTPTAITTFEAWWHGTLTHTTLQGGQRIYWYTKDAVNHWHEGAFSVAEVTAEAPYNHVNYDWTGIFTYIPATAGLKSAMIRFTPCTHTE